MQFAYNHHYEKHYRDMLKKKKRYIYIKKREIMNS